MSWYGNVSLRQRRTYTILIGIIALTAPCYCIGLSALALAPGTRASRSPATSTLAPPFNTPVMAVVTLPPDATLRLMPTEGQPHTLTPTPTSSPTSTGTPTSSPTSTGTPTSSPTVSRPTETPTPPPTPEPTNITEPTATPLPDAYTLLIAKRGEDSLFMVNESARAFPLAALRLGDGEGAINGREWGIDTLEPGECVTAWKKGGKPQPPNISCTQVGKRLIRSGAQRFWTSAFKVYYLGEQAGNCADAQCTITIVMR